MAERQFCTLEEAESYFATRLHSEAWTSAGGETKTVALIQATRIFNAFLRWREPLAEPYPAALKWATCEMALYLLQEDPLAKDSMAGLSRIKLGELEIEAASGSRRRTIPEYIFAMLAGLADMAVSGCSIPVIRC